MRFFACQQCRSAWQVGGDPKEVNQVMTMIEDRPPCITPLCLGRLEKIEAIPWGFKGYEIPLPSFFRAINGFGSPEGRAATVKEFTELLKTRKVVEVRADPTGQPERVILKRIVLDDGTRLHFDASSKGACCYYIEKSGPSCLEVVDDEIRTEGDPEIGVEDREEAGRGSEASDQLGFIRTWEATSPVAPSGQPSAIPLPSLSSANKVSGGGASGPDEHDGDD